MQADPATQLRLLDLQELDSRADALRTRLGSLPEAVKLADVTQRREQMDGTVRDLRVVVSDVTAEQERADADVEQVKARRARNQQLLDGGSVGDPKALDRLVGEQQSLQRRIGELEDVELEVMERLESAQTDLAAREADLAELDGHRGQLQAELDERQAGLRAELAEVEAQRAPVAAELPDDLVALYERLRAQKGGVGAAALRRRECGGCRLTLNPADLATIAAAPEDRVVRCEECSRILVRTPESGL